MSSISLAAADIRVVSSDRSGFHFIVPVRQADLDWFAEGADSLMTAYLTVQVGIPYGSEVMLTRADRQQAVPLGPLGFQKSRLSTAARPPVSVGRPHTVRGRQLVSLRIFPLAAGELYREVEIAVAFRGGLTDTAPQEKDPFFDRIFKAVVANYDQFNTWPAAARPASKLTVAPAGPFANPGPWLRVAVNQTGLYRITGSQIDAAGIALSDITPANIQLYWGGGLPLAVPNEVARPTLDPVPVIVEDGGDGAFDPGDYILFFGESQDRFVYSADSVTYVNNPYTDRNVYWLSLLGSAPGLRMASVAGTAGGTPQSSYTKYLHVEQNNMLRRLDNGRINDYYSWYWSDQEDLTFFVSAPVPLANDTADVTLVGLTGGSYMDLTVNGVAGLDRICNSSGCSYRTVSLVDGPNEFSLHLDPTAAAPPYFDYCELSYQTANVPEDDRLDLTLGVLQGSTQVEVVNGFTSNPLILDVTDPANPAVVSGASVSTDWIFFDADLAGTVFSRFYLTPGTAALSPLSLEPAQPEDLYAVDDQVDLIVVAPVVLAPHLSDYVGYRSPDYSIKQVSVENIMDNFGWGLYDPTAIRDFLKYAYENYPSPAPSAVLFVGDGNYDFLDNTGTGIANFVPPCIHPLDNSASDDNYIYFGDYGILDSDTSYSPTDRGFDMISARWPVRTSGEIATIADKITDYESPSHFGIWRNGVTLVADDEYIGGSPSVSELIHTFQTEQLANEHMSPLFNLNKVYLIEYPFVNNGKPEVNEAVIKSFNEGTLVVNYVGHGNPDVWAHEHVFNRSSDLPRLSNADRLSLVFAASCAIGFFDDPSREGMAEDLLAMAGGGAIGVMSATRLVTSVANAQFNQAVFDVLFQNDSLSMCEAMYAAKLARQYVGDIPFPVSNDRKYLYFGGPFTGLAIPELDVEFTGIPDSLAALSRTVVSGRVLDGQANVLNRDGVLFVNVFDSEREKTYRIVNSSGVILDEVEYSVSGPTIYRGSATITGGEFEFEFLPPLDIGYGGQGARISVYARFDDIDAAGVADSIVVSETIAVSSDSTGPSIQVAVAGRHSFVSGDYIEPDDRLVVTVSDPSGINLTGAIGHGITLEIDWLSENLINLTPLFEADQDDFTTGSLEYALQNLQPGSHHFKLKAWDNANNSTGFEFDAEVLATQPLAIRDLLNYPNPMSQSTRFSYYLTRPVEKFTLELFTLAGRKIKSFQRYSLAPGYYDDIEWYGRDFDGSRVATEVYIYKATAYPAAGGDKVESFGKLVLIN
ncbi:MAG: type IX secretion system sortase PorU [Candidatus Zixiibacteriota bacterium]|nr:MAG: type IX secretion system sortase PorU [candidate division Zixibacteria bacterium]